MDKANLEAFLTPFDPDVRILVRMPNGELAEFSGVTIGFVSEGERAVILELPSE